MQCEQRHGGENGQSSGQLESGVDISIMGKDRKETTKEGQIVKDFFLSGWGKHLA